VNSDLEQFLSEWDRQYLVALSRIDLFQPEITSSWTLVQQQRLVQLFFHVRGGFAGILLELGNAAPDAHYKNIILKNLHDEFGGHGPSHRELFLRLGRAVGADLSREQVEKRYNIPVIQQYNDVQVRSIVERGWTLSLIGFIAGERLDYIDYNALKQVFESFGVRGPDLDFFSEHMQAGHFDGTLAESLQQECDKNPATVSMVFNAALQFQLDMWRNLTEEITKATAETEVAPGVSTIEADTRSSSSAERKTRASGLHYNHAGSPALASKFSDVAALDAGDGKLLQLRFSDDSLRRIHEARARTDWGRDVLIFGGNGFVGAHFIHELLRRPQVRRVTAVLRARAGMSPLERIRTTWRRYDLDPAMVDLTKIQAFDGTMYLPKFGLDDKTYDTLASNVDSVIQGSGSTDYEPGYLELRSEWVLGLMGVIQFCFQKQAKRLNYIGSVISRLYAEPRDFQRPDSWWYSGYAQMKWVNQQILDRLSSIGFPAQICEAPYVLGSTTVGKDPGLHYSFWRAVSLGALLQMVWDGYFLDFTTVDLLVNTVLMNAFAGKPLPVVRPIVPYRVRNADVAHLLGCQVVSWEEFREEVRKYATPEQMRIISDNAPDGIERSCMPPIYPEGFDIAGFPSGDQLARLYLKNLNLLAVSPKRGAARQHNHS